METTTLWNMSGETFGHLAHMKNGGNLLIDFDVKQSMYGFEKEKIDRILKSWNLK